MEDGLGAQIINVESVGSRIMVLILVLVEDGLGANGLVPMTKLPGVLILVLVEDGLGDPYAAFLCEFANGS